MLVLEENNRSIESSLRDCLNPDNSKRAVDLRFCDFGETRYHLYSDEGQRDALYLSMALPSAKGLLALGLEQHLQSRLAGVKLIAAESGYDLTIQLCRSQLDDKLVKDLACLRSTCLSLPLEIAMEAQRKGQQSAVMTIPLRSSDVMYVQGTPDRVLVVLSTRFDDPSDAVLGKVFLQEFFDVRRLNNLENAPSVLFGREPPKELQSQIPAKKSEAEGSFITLILFPCHYPAGAKREKCISMVLSFRDYFHYHIKCCKSYLHDRMRSKVSEFLKLLNRTKPLCLTPSPSQSASHGTSNGSSSQ